MKKIFYSLMAVALCACSQSDVDDNMVTPQPENNGVTFTVVDNGFIGEDGTRVTYGDYDTSTAYKATFEEGDQIGVYAIKAMGTDNTPATYGFENKPLTLTNGKWVSSESLDLTDVKVLFAYSPYRADASVTGDYAPLFTGADDSWEVDNTNNRNGFFVGGNLYNITDNSGDNFKLNDWMSDAVNVTAGQTDFTFEMKHMRGMVEVTTAPNVELTDLTLAIGSDKGAQYHFTPYVFATTDTKKVYRILTTEYRHTNTVYATIKDLNITKKYKKTLSGNGAGKCFCVNINYTPEATIEVGNGKSLQEIVEGMSPAPTTLRLKGTLSDADWTYLQGLSLTSLDMYQLQNTEIPANWMKNATTLKASLTSLVLPNDLLSIGGDAMQFPDETVITIELPASVTTVEAGAFYSSNNVSVRIPEDSQLQTIGQGAFVYTKAVYTDPASVNVLKIPASVTKIDGAAFGGITDLKKVIFQSETAPEIVNGAYAVTFNNSVKVYVPNNSYKGKFTTGMTVFVGPGLTASNFNTPYTWNGSWADGIGLAGLCDGVTGVNGTHWHSQYSGTYGEWGIYIDITLPTKAAGYNPLTVSYTTRAENGGGAPTKVRMAVSNDGETYTQVGEDFTLTTLPGGNETFTLDPIAVGTNKYVRFAILEAKGNSVVGETGQSANLAELTLYEETWTEE